LYHNTLESAMWAGPRSHVAKLDLLDPGEFGAIIPVD
jgi:hypothetical protein